MNKETKKVCKVDDDCRHTRLHFRVFVFAHLYIKCLRVECMYVEVKCVSKVYTI